MGTNEMTAMPPFLLRRREIPCRCSPVREVLRERFGDEAGRFRVVFSEGVVVIGGASGCLITWRWTLTPEVQRKGGRVQRRGGVGGMQPQSWEDNISQTSSLLLYFILIVELDCPLLS
jgi:hypothetical protein